MLSGVLLCCLLPLAHGVLGCHPSRERKEVKAEALVEMLKENQRRKLDEESEKCFITQSNAKPADKSAYCDVIWDGVMCWPLSAPGNLATQPCPQYIIGFLPQGVATKRCMDNGDWFMDETNNTWTNYSQCMPTHNATQLVPVGPIEDSALLARWVPILKVVSQIGYSVSLMTLVVAFLLLSTMKKLRCPRNMLHLHLFLSFMMRASVTLLIDMLFINGVGLAKDLVIHESGLVTFVPDRNNWECKVLITVWHYCIIANYTWIFMEGLYLHNLIFLALFSDTSAITLYVILGWGLPILFVVPWTVARLKLEDTMCWTTHDNSNVFLLIRIPVIVSVLLSFTLFLNIVRVLLVKLQSTVYLERRRLRYRRWAKSTLVLVPLFGVHYVLFIWLSPTMALNETLEIVCLFCDQLFASFQGFFVSLLYCLLNSEVRAELLRKWRSYSYDQHQPKRGSAQSLPIGMHSMLTISRMYNGAGGRGGSLSSASGVASPEAIEQTIPSVAITLRDQKADLNPIIRSSTTQEVSLNGHCQENNNKSDECGRTVQLQNGFQSDTKTSEQFTERGNIHNVETSFEMKNDIPGLNDLSGNLNEFQNSSSFLKPSTNGYHLSKQNGVSSHLNSPVRNGLYSLAKHANKTDCNSVE